MAKFLFQAKKFNGQVVQGEVDAASEKEVRVRLRAQQLIPLKIVVSKKDSQKEASFLDQFTKRVPERDLQVFTRQFATLIGAGITVVDSLRILGEGLRGGLLKDCLLKVKANIEGGKRLGESMGEFPTVFDRLYVNMVKAGEEAGVLEAILTRLAVYMEKSGALKRKVQGALWYPGIVVVVTMLIVAFIMTFIIPKFQSLYAGVGKEPPWLTQVVVGLSHSMAENWYIVLALIVGTPLGLLYYYRTNAGRDAIDQLMIKAPIFGELVRKSAVAKLSRTLSTLLHSGVDIIDAIDIASKTAGNKVVEDALLRAKASISQGKTIAAPLMKEQAIPDMVVQMISVGEQSGTLDQMLGKIADFYEEETEALVLAMTTIIEPLLMVFIGGVIAVLVIAMYLPIFNMAGVLGGG